MQREREAWREIQTERDALLEEKHRWAMVRERSVVAVLRRTLCLIAHVGGRTG